MRKVLLLAAAALLPLPATGHAQLDSARAHYSAHRYRDAERTLERVLARNPRSADALVEKTRLLIQAWRLDAADSVTYRIGHDDIRALLLHGRIQLLKKEFSAALATAREAQRRAPRNAEAFLLEADVHFWDQKPDLAEAPLLRALELDPRNADARFAYGYAIWRRVDAQQLPAMAEQWNTALEIDPLHYVTHWHFGNGHTHLTYADYAQPSDSIVRVLLRGADSLVAQERIADALARTREIERAHPRSLIAPLTRGSIFYMAYDLPRAERLDSAQAVFLDLLARKKNYGPAHNGLAAVIKQRQLEYVANYDSLEAAIAAEPLPNDSAFTRVFKDLSYYPGVRAEKMARQQIGPALAYIPFLARLGYTYTVPPLHRDLTDALNRPFFRSGTTFDNRQWMDIRGVGGNHAAAGIEYVERGSHQERVVLLHEFVHQWHGAVLTDAENRRIRELYNEAMANGRVLDYYSANNESEFFAQAYEAYLSPVKVHPLNHKAMNTRADLIGRDPVLFAFLDTLINRNRAFLAGDRDAMRSNWAQVYVTLAERQLQAAEHSKRWDIPSALLDSALTHDAAYAPALLARAAVLRAQQRWAAADSALNRAEAVAPGYAPVFSARAELAAARARADKRDADVQQLAGLYGKALAMETDLAERADLNRALRELYRDNLLFDQAIAVAREQIDREPAPSTYLRDQKDNAAAFIAAIRSRLGDHASATTVFDDLLKRKPQHFGFRAQAAAALLEAGKPHEALAVIEAGEQILRAGGQTRDDYTIIKIAALRSVPGDTTASALLGRFTPGKVQTLSDEDRVRLIRELILRGRHDEAAALMPADSDVRSPLARQDYRRLRELMRASRTAK